MSEVIVPSVSALRAYSKHALFRHIQNAIGFLMEPEGGDWPLTPFLEILYLRSVIAACEEFDLRYGSTFIDERMFVSAVLYFYIQDLGNEHIISAN